MAGHVGVGIGGGKGESPEIVGAVFVGDEDDGEGRVGVDGVDAVGGRGVVFASVGGEGFQEGVSARCLLAVRRLDVLYV